MSARYDRIQELAADRVLWGLSATEEREFAAFGDDALQEHEVMERAGAAIAAVLCPASDTPPPDVLDRLRSAAGDFLRGASRDPEADRAAALVRPAAKGAPSDRAAGVVQWSGWVAAAAAALVAVVLWFDRSDGGVAIPLDEQLERFLVSHPDAQVRAWEQGAKGDVIWSPSAQAGFLVLRDLPANEPRAFQYQLWIFDRQRSEETPVDGGVFDVRQDGQVVVPIDAKLLVHDAAAFAVTKEPPGGVVVSAKKPEQIVALAKL